MAEYTNRSAKFPHEQAHWKFGSKSSAQTIKVLASSSLKTNQAHHSWNISFSCLYTEHIINLFKCQQQTSSRFPTLHPTSLCRMEREVLAANHLSRFSTTYCRHVLGYILWNLWGWSVTGRSLYWWLSTYMPGVLVHDTPPLLSPPALPPRPNNDVKSIL